MAVSGWLFSFFFTFTKQFASIHWSNFPLTMCYETEKNKSKSIEPVLMYNLQGQHLAANIKIFFHLLVVLLNNLVASRWLFFQEKSWQQVSWKMIKYLETLNSCSSACAHKRPKCVFSTLLSILTKTEAQKNEEHLISYHFSNVFQSKHPQIEAHTHTHILIPVS